MLAIVALLICRHNPTEMEFRDGDFGRYGLSLQQDEAEIAIVEQNTTDRSLFRMLPGVAGVLFCLSCEITPDPVR